MMTNEEAKEILSKINIAVSCGATPILLENEIVEATNVAIKALERKSYKSEARRWKRRYLDVKVKEKEWLQTFNTESATECYTAVQRLKEGLNADSD